MDGPSVAFRRQIYARLLDLGDAEEQVDRILAEVADQVSGAVSASDVGALDSDAANDLLGAVNSWAALASQVVQAFYAPASPIPFRGGLAGWSKDIAKHLTKITNMLAQAVRAVAHALNALAWSVGVVFPWGVEVSLSWT